MVKARRGLLLSLLTMIVALGVTVTSTFAWFAVNTSVSATNMQVTVKSDTTYLVISASEAANVDAIGTDITAAATELSNQVLPVRYNDNATPESGNSKWETAVGNGYSDAAAKGGLYTPVATANIGDYTVKYTFYVGLTSTTALPATDLKVTGLTATANSGVSDVFLPAISCLVVCSSGGSEISSIDFENVNSNTVKNTNNAILSSTVAKNTVYVIDVYVYVNGEHTNVTSANATSANLGGFKLSMTLEVTRGV